MLGSLIPPLAASADLRLTFESATPCRFVISSFALDYALVRETFPAQSDGSRAPKQVLRFPPGTTSRRALDIELPRAATIDAATLRAVLSLRDDRLLPAVAESTPPLQSAPGSPHGVMLEPLHTVAQPVRLAQAVTVCGVTLAVLTLAPSTRLWVEVDQDWQGQPAGRKVAEGSVELGAAGLRTWANVTFGAPAVLTTQQHWLMVGVSSGAALWLLLPDESSLCIFERDVRGEPTPHSAVVGYQALYRYFSRTAPPADAPAAQIEPGCVVSVADVTVDADDPAVDSRAYDLSGALATFLAAQPSTPSTVRVPLAFTSSASGLATVYPPTIQYQLP
jgi:hypothetical protein